LLIAPPLLLLGAPAPPGCIPGEHLLHLPVETQVFEKGALLAPDLVRDGGRLAPIFEREDVGGMTVLQQVHCGGMWSVTLW